MRSPCQIVHSFRAVAGWALLSFVGFSPACLAQSNTTLGTVIDVRNPGPGACGAANANGADDYQAFSCKLSQFSPAGGILFIPAGTYYISSTLNIPQNVSVRGTGYGSILHQKHSLLTNLIKLGTNTELRDLELTQDQPAPGANWVPYLDYDYQVWVHGVKVNIDNVMLLNPTRGILVRSNTFPNSQSGTIGQIHLNNVRGQPLASGIYVDGNTDISRFEDIHFWPFWSLDSHVLDWVGANGIGVETYRNYNPIFNNIFTFQYYIGMRFGISPVQQQTAVTGVTSRARISGYDCDFCGYGIYVDGPGTNGLEIDNFDVNSTGLPPVYINTYNVSVAISKLDTINSATNVVRVLGNYNSVVISDSLIRGWNKSGVGFPAFEIAPGAIGSIISISNTIYNNGNGASVQGGATIITNAVTQAPGLL
jgi:hypothetical protein